MGALIIVLLKPIVKIPLELVQIPIQFLPEGDPVELVQNRLVERLADAVRLRPPGLRLGMFNLVVL